ncbi:hypothetical protein BKA62DRAFT_719450 [Auriculariales sp. MPI-PUGE-AT-0066]|nr:hypothetical protein BKA62DRAFT_719450 [Auriculariales sp. MPI-PUGE-AT-0066]
MTTVDSWDQSVRTSTFNFVYEDSTVWLRIGNERFKVSRRRLCTASPVFATMFELLKDKEAIVILHNNVHEFKDFLWYLHVSYNTTQNARRRKRYYRALNIASIAHFYQATAITEWAVSELNPQEDARVCISLWRQARFFFLGSRNTGATKLTSRKTLLAGWLPPKKFATRISKLMPTFTVLGSPTAFYGMTTVSQCLIVCVFTWRREPAAAWARRLQMRQYNVGWTHPAYIPPSRRNTYTGDVCDPRSWLPRTNTPLRKLYDGVSLWNMFTRSPMGLDLPDGTEISIPASSSS